MVHRASVWVCIIPDLPEFVNSEKTVIPALRQSRHRDHRHNSEMDGESPPHLDM